PKLVFPNGRLQEAGCLINPGAPSTQIGLRDDPDAPEYCRSREVDYCSGACLLVRGAFLRELGGFGERFGPAYGEDVDLCIAARAAGLRVLYCADVTVLHHRSASHDAVDQALKQRQSAANRKKLVEKWGEAMHRRGGATRHV